MAKALGMKEATEAGDFLKALDSLLEECGVAEITMNEFGVKESELPQMAFEVRSTLGPAFECDPAPLTVEDCAEIYRKSYK